MKVKTLFIMITICILSIFSVAKDSDANFLKGIANFLNIKGNILTIKPYSDDNYIRLDWNFDNYQPYTYKAYKKTNNMGDFQSISMANLDDGKKVQVLNVYPTVDATGDIPLTDSFTTWDNETVSNLPKSACLKKWMEEPNIEHEKGYGKGLIKITTIDIKSFNDNPAKYLFNSSGDYIYDVIVFGFWDCNGNDDDLTITALKEVEKYILSGKGVLFGHDTIRSTMTNFKSLRQYINIELPGDTNIDIPNSATYSILSRNIVVRKKGLLTEYPWVIDKSELLIPLTHSSRQFARGDVWLDFSKIDTTSYPGWEGVIYNGKDGLVTNNIYLTTWNNTAYIQTGHSKGEATLDEQKILANTIFYLSQLSTDNYLNDMSGQDINAPEEPIINNSNIDINNKKFSFNLKNIEDIGTRYSYYIEATGQNDSVVKTSNTVETEIKSGFKGYSYIVDTKENTEPDDIVDTNKNVIEFNFNKPTSNKYYLHIKSIDNVGNCSKTLHYEIGDTELPNIELTISNDDFTNGEVLILGQALDNLKVDFVALPNGDKIYSENVSYSVTEDGEYEFIVYDIFGNYTRNVISISNIDRDKPIININQNTTNWINTPIQIDINAKD